MARPASQSQVDVGAMLNRLSTGDKIIGVSLILLFIDSFIGSWFHYSIDNCGVLGAAVGCSGTYGSLWSGIGILAALLLIAAIAFYVVRLFFSAQVQLPPLPLRDWQIWTGFGIVQVVLFFLHWLIGRGSYSGVDISSVPGISRTPGWAWYIGIILAIVIAIGGYLKQHDPEPVAIAGGGTAGGGYGTYGGGTPSQPGYGPPQYGAPPPPPAGYPEQPSAPGYQPPAPPPAPPGEQPPPPPPSGGGYGAPPQP